MRKAHPFVAFMLAHEAVSQPSTVHTQRIQQAKAEEKAKAILAREQFYARRSTEDSLYERKLEELTRIRGTNA